MESEHPPSLGAGDELPLVRTPPPGPRSRDLAARLAQVESPAFGARRAARAKASGTEMGPIVYAEGKGANVTDVDGNRYVDLTAGFGALLLGHRPASIERALAAQSARLWHGLGDVYGSDAKLALLERVVKLYPYKDSRILLGQSGADAVTAALKTAVLATGRTGVVAFEGSYHGLSYGPLAVSSFKPSYRTPFAAQLNPDVSFVPFPRTEGDLVTSFSALRHALGSGTVGAVIIEPILGRGGCLAPPSGFLSEVSRLTHAASAVLIADEIWTGLGRAGETSVAFADGADPDLVCFGKGLGGGLPLSACVGRDSVMRAWADAPEEVIHTATFHGSPLACRTGAALLDVLQQEKLAERSADVGARFRASLRRALPPAVATSVHGRGLLVGITLAGEGRAFACTRELLAAGYLVLTGGSSHDTLTLTPPLDIAEHLLDAFVVALTAILERATTSP